VSGVPALELALLRAKSDLCVGLDAIVYLFYVGKVRSLIILWSFINNAVYLCQQS
jgi:hypothetical protein